MSCNKNELIMKCFLVERLLIFFTFALRADFWFGLGLVNYWVSQYFQWRSKLYWLVPSLSTTEIKLKSTRSIPVFRVAYAIWPTLLVWDWYFIFSQNINDKKIVLGSIIIGSKPHSQCPHNTRVNFVNTIYILGQTKINKYVNKSFIWLICKNWN